MDYNSVLQFFCELAVEEDAVISVEVGGASEAALADHYASELVGERGSALADAFHLGLRDSTPEQDLTRAAFGAAVERTMRRTANDVHLYLDACGASAPAGQPQLCARLRVQGKALATARADVAAKRAQLVRAQRRATTARSRQLMLLLTVAGLRDSVREADKRQAAWLKASCAATAKQLEREALELDASTYARDSSVGLLVVRGVLDRRLRKAEQAAAELERKLKPYRRADSGFVQIVREHVSLNNKIADVRQQLHALPLQE
eukprot:g3840.t1